MAHYLNLPTLRVPDAQRASWSSSVSSASSYNSAGFDRHSKNSQSTDLTPLITPLDSIDSIFGDDPDLEPLPHLSDAIPWRDLTDEQGKRHTRISNAEYAITTLASVDSIFGDDPDLDSSEADGLTDEQWELRSMNSKAEYAISDEHWKLRSLISKAEYAIREAEIAISKNLDEAFLWRDVRDDEDLSETDEDFDAVGAVRTRIMKDEQTATTLRALEIMDRRSGLASSLTEVNNSGEYEHPATRRDVVEEFEDYAEDFELADDGILEVPITPNSSGRRSFLGYDSTLETIEEVDESTEQDSMLDEDTLSSPYVIDPGFPSTPMIHPLDTVRNCSSFSTSDRNASTADSISQLVMSPLVLDDSAIFHDSFGDFDNPISSSPVSSFPFKKTRSRLPIPTSLLDESLDIIEGHSLEIAAGLRNNRDITLDAGVRLIDCPTQRTQGTRGEGLSTFCAVPVADEPRYGLTSGIDESILEMSSFPVDSPANSEHAHAQSSAPTMSMARNSNSAMESSIINRVTKGFGLRLPMGLKQRLSRRMGIPTSGGHQDLASSAPPVNRLRKLRRQKAEATPVSCSSPYTKQIPSPTKSRNIFKRALSFLF